MSLFCFLNFFRGKKLNPTNCFLCYCSPSLFLQSLSGGYYQLSSLSCKKCPAGSFTLCSQNEESRCEKCPDGTYSDKPSRRGTCKRCARCAYNEFESHPCNSTSNTVCVKCRKCPLGFGVFRPCEKRRDTDCVKCPVSEGWFSDYLKNDCGFKGNS